MKFGRLEPNTTIRELINDYVDPKDREIIKCVFEDKIKNVNEEIRKHGNIVVHENDIPKGILYTGDLSASDEELNDKLGDFIEKKKPVDKITGKKWTKNGVENYAVISYKHTLSEAKTLMDSIKKNNPTLVGIVLEDGKMMAIVNYETLTKAYL